MLTPLMTLILLAAPANGVDEALARRLSPGAVALLLEHAGDARARDRIGLALKAEDPGTRALAARVADVGVLEALAPRVGEALAIETSAVAAVEEARALLTLDPQSDDLVVDAARRLGGATAGDLGVALATIRGPRALSKLEALCAAGLPATRYWDFLERAGRAEPSKLMTVGPFTLRSHDPALWASLIGNARVHEADVPADLLASALSDGLLRERTLEHLALAGPGNGPRSEVLARALDAARAAVSPESRTLAFELVDRADRRPPVDQSNVIRQADNGLLNFLRLVFGSPHVRDRLSPGERQALRTRLNWPENRKDPDEPRKATGGDSRPVVRLATGAGYPSGFLSDLLAASGCVPNDRWLLGGQLSHDPLGRPTGVAVYGDIAGGPACLAAARALLLTDLQGRPPDPASAGRDLLLLPLDPEILSCLEAPEPADPGLARPTEVGGKIQEPRKTRSVAPHYPDSAKSEHVSGVVILEAVISPTGCIAGLRVLKGVDLRLDVAALRAVAGWRYTPTLLGSVPVPVIMTVTVNFKLT